jgi:putative PIN family toxin of toxin-antitoxin system
MQHRFVLDTNVLIAALRSRSGASFRLLQTLADDDRLQLCLSTALLLEYEEIIARFRSELPISDESIREVLDFLCSIAVVPIIYFRWRPTLSDPDDDFLLDLAVAGRCSFVVTFNRRDLQGAESFGVKIVSPAQFLSFLEESS